MFVELDMQLRCMELSEVGKRGERARHHTTAPCRIVSRPRLAASIQYKRAHGADRWLRHVHAMEGCVVVSSHRPRELACS